MNTGVVVFLQKSSGAKVFWSQPVQNFFFLVDSGKSRESILNVGSKIVQHVTTIVQAYVICSFRMWDSILVLHMEQVAWKIFMIAAFICENEFYLYKRQFSVPSSVLMDKGILFLTTHNE